MKDNTLASLLTTSLIRRVWCCLRGAGSPGTPAAIYLLPRATRWLGVVGMARAIRAITAEPARGFAELRYRWNREGRVAGKAEALCGKENPRYVVSSLPAKERDARVLYEDLY